MNAEEAADIARQLPGVTEVKVLPERVLRYPPRLEITGPPLGEDRAYIYQAMEAAKERPGEWDYAVLMAEDLA